MDGEESFPRGGTTGAGSGDNPSAKKEKQGRRFGDAPPGGGKSQRRGRHGASDGQESAKKKRKARKNEDDDDVDGGGSLQKELGSGKLPKHVSVLTAKRVGPGMKVWGCVTGVTRHHLEVSLPHGLKGKVAADQTSDSAWQQAQEQGDKTLANGDAGEEGSALHSLPDIFHEGQLVPCVVLAAEGADGG